MLKWFAGHQIKNVGVCKLSDAFLVCVLELFFLLFKERELGQFMLVKIIISSFATALFEKKLCDILSQLVVMSQFLIG